MLEAVRRVATSGRRRDAAFWGAVAVASAATLVASALPTFEIGLVAYIGAGNEQRGFEYTRELTLLHDLRPWSLAAIGAQLALLALAAAALVGGTRAWIVLVACAISLLGLRGVIDTEERLGWPEASGVVGYDEPSAGRLLQPELDRLKRDARRSPEAASPEWELLGGEHGYRARGLVGWRVIERVAVALALLTTYRTFRLFLRPAPALVATAAAAIAVVLWLVVEAFRRLE